MNAATKNKFRRLLLEHRAELTGDASGLENEAKHAAPEVRMPTHMADLASDAGALEESLGQIEVIGDEVRQIDAALARLDEGTYGVCTKCGEKISTGRLKARPFSELCIRCKQAQEEGE